MKHYLAAACVALILAFGALATQATSADASPQVAQCYWPKDSYWHYSPGYDVWFQWVQGSYSPVGFWYFGAMTGYQWVVYWNYC